MSPRCRSLRGMGCVCADAGAAANAAARQREDYCPSHWVIESKWSPPHSSNPSPPIIESPSPSTGPARKSLPASPRSASLPSPPNSVSLPSPPHRCRCRRAAEQVVAAELPRTGWRPALPITAVVRAAAGDVLDVRADVVALTRRAVVGDAVDVHGDRRRPRRVVGQIDPGAAVVDVGAVVGDEAVVAAERRSSVSSLPRPRDDVRAGVAGERVRAPAADDVLDDRVVALIGLAVVGDAVERDGHSGRPQAVVDAILAVAAIHRVRAGPAVEAVAAVAAEQRGRCRARRATTRHRRSPGRSRCRRRRRSAPPRA